jgi:hypothetical protein
MHFACARIRTNSSCISTCKSTRAVDLQQSARTSGRFFFLVRRRREAPFVLVLVVVLVLECSTRSDGAMEYRVLRSD